MSTVPRGLDCKCQCLDCGQPLLARQGQIRDHHFAHESGREHDWAWETHLHAYAKQLIADAGGLMVPLHSGIREHLGLPERQRTWHLKATPLGVVQEAARGAVRPDLIVQVPQRQAEIALEVYVTHAADEAKRQEFKRQRLPALEINLSHLHQERLKLFELRAAVLEKTENKRWLWPLPLASAPARSGVESVPAARQHVPAAPPAVIALPNEPLPMPAPATHSFHVPGWRATVIVKVEPSEDSLRVEVEGMAIGRMETTPVELAAPRIAELVDSTITAVNSAAQRMRNGLWFVPGPHAGKVAEELRRQAESYDAEKAEQLRQQAAAVQADLRAFRGPRAPRPTPLSPRGSGDNPYSRRKG